MHDSMPLKGILKNWWHRSLAERRNLYLGNPTETSVTTKERQSWLQISYMKYAYHTMSPKFTLGWMAEMLYSSKNFSENYTATMLQAADFSPTPHSKLMYNEAFGPTNSWQRVSSLFLFSMICSNSVLNFMVSYRYFLLKRMH